MNIKAVGIDLAKQVFKYVSGFKMALLGSVANRDRAAIN